jgi:hypothetical protein
VRERRPYAMSLAYKHILLRPINPSEVEMQRKVACCS